MQSTPPQNKNDGSLTAADFLESQLQLEKQAREAMPYEPDTCTYPQAKRQLVFACLTCRKENNDIPIGVCYSCSIQCHSTHELVELFAKRGFVCDCGTARMAAGAACCVRMRQARKNSVSGPKTTPRMRSGSVSGSSAGISPFSPSSISRANDIEASGNSYNQNYAGRFCSCSVLYNPVQESQTMHQCFLGDACGEDWFHQECILGYKQGAFHKKLFAGTGENKLHDLEPPGMDAAADAVAKLATTETEDSGENGGNDGNDESDELVPHFPPLDSFGEFVCWKCVAKNQVAFSELNAYPGIVVATRRHFENVSSAEEWVLLDEAQNTDDLPPKKRQKLENGSLTSSEVPYSVFLTDNVHLKLASISQTLPVASPLRLLLTTFDFLTTEDPVYQPEEDDVISTQASEGSLYDLGSSALSSLPIPQALEGLQAYDVMKEKLKGFFKDFVDQKKVVTEEEVRSFFDKMKDK